MALLNAVNTATQAVVANGFIVYTATNVKQGCGIKFNDGSYMEFKTQHECANHFNVKPSRIYGWIYKNKGYLKYNIKNIFYLNKWGSNEAFLQKQKDEAFDPENPFGDLWQG